MLKLLSAFLSMFRPSQPLRPGTASGRGRSTEEKSVQSHEDENRGKGRTSLASPSDMKLPPHQLSRIRKVIGVVSGKGGVGKSLVSGMLAAKMQARGSHAAILDADITGPSIPRLFGVTELITGSGHSMTPARSATGVDMISMNLLLPHDTDPVIWRGPVITNVITQFWQNFVWNDVDFMFVDMPPGTGDVPLTVYQSLPVDGIVIVTSPQDLVSMIVEKAVNMVSVAGLNVPILALVENMSYFECPGCGQRHFIYGESHLEEIASRHGIPVTARIPIDPAIARACDSGAVEALQCPWLDGVADAIAAL